MILRQTHRVRGLKETSHLREQFGNRVRLLRSNDGLTQEQLAERAGISVDFLSLIERGKNSPSFDNLEDLADALGVTVAELFSFKETALEAE
jgi:transcriptional regulator with XRE-family HTH domain